MNYPGTGGILFLSRYYDMNLYSDMRCGYYDNTVRITEKPKYTKNTVVLVFKYIINNINTKKLNVH